MLSEELGGSFITAERSPVAVFDYDYVFVCFFFFNLQILVKGSKTGKKEVRK